MNVKRALVTMEELKGVYEEPRANTHPQQDGLLRTLPTTLEGQRSPTTTLDALYTLRRLQAPLPTISKKGRRKSRKEQKDLTNAEGPWITEQVSRWTRDPSRPRMVTPNKHSDSRHSKLNMQKVQS